MKKKKEIVLGVVVVLAILIVGFVCTHVDVDVWMPVVIFTLFMYEAVQWGKMTGKKQ